MSTQPPYPGDQHGGQQPGPQQPGPQQPGPYGPQQPGPSPYGPQQPGPSPYGPPPGPSPYGPQPPGGSPQPPGGPPGPPPGGHAPGGPGQQPPATPGTPGTSGAGPDFLPPSAMPPGQSGPPPYPAAPPPGGGGKGGAFVVVSIVLALIVVAGAAFGAWHFWLRDDDSATASEDSSNDDSNGNSDGDSGGSSENNADEDQPPEANLTGKIAWEHDWPDSKLGQASLGTWELDGGVIAVARPDTLIAYNVDDGSTAWQVTIPKGRAICGVSADTAGDVGAVALSKKTSQGPECAELMAVDVSDGSAQWTETLPDNASGSSMNIAVTPSSIVVGDYDVFRISTDGGRFTEFQVGASGSDSYGCFINDFAATKDDQILFAGSCDSAGSGSGEEEAKLFKLDPDTGETTWEKPIKLTNTDDRAELVSADPIIVSVSGGRADKLLNFDQSGEQLSTIDQVSDEGDLLFEESVSGYVNDPKVRVSVGENNPHNVLATEDTLYVRTDTGSSVSSDEPAKLLAFDRKSGTMRWNTELKDQPSMLLAGVDESGVVVLGRGKDRSYDENGTAPEAFHVGAKQGEVTSLGKGYDDLISDKFSVRRMEAFAVWTGDSVVVVDWSKDEISDGDGRFIYTLR